ncbi:MAG: DNA alkylation repair protein [Rhodobacteraceae bacterium]|nr:DNA alkylation repair protein [Paracoccaceae bacterium]
MNALDTLRAAGNAEKAAEMVAYHKQTREIIGLANPQIDTFVKGWRAELSLDDRLALAAELWQSDVFEARIAAAKLLVQARISPDDGVWTLISSWVPELDSWAIADHVSTAAAKRIVALPARLDEVEAWTHSKHMWSRRAALVATLPWAKLNHLTPAQNKSRERILGWAARYVDDQDWFMQKAVSWWLRDLSKHDPARTTAFLTKHGERMKPFARKNAAKYLS